MIRDHMHVQQDTGFSGTGQPRDSRASILDLRGGFC